MSDRMSTTPQCIEEGQAAGGDHMSSPTAVPSADHATPAKQHTDLRSCQRDLNQTKELLQVQIKHAEELQRRTALLEQELKKNSGNLRYEITNLSRQLLHVQAHESLSIEALIAQAQYRFDNCGPRAALLKEREALLVEVEYQKQEAQHWKAQAFCHGSQFVKQCMQHAVDERVRKLRDHQDATAFANLKREISRLEARINDEVKRREAAERETATLHSQRQCAQADPVNARRGSSSSVDQQKRPVVQGQNAGVTYPRIADPSTGKECG